MFKATADWAPLPLRLVLGFGFIYHGYPKLFTAEGQQMFVGMLQQIGVPAPGLTSWLVGAVEFFGGLALILGIGVTIVAVLGIIEMLVAMFTVHLPHGFNFMNITGMGPEGPEFGMPGYEVNLLYLAGFAALALLGAGRFSLEEKISGRRTIDQASRDAPAPAAGVGGVQRG
ncbi:MAG: DoxX family protein [Longimicrobiaceae bacterium]